MRSQDTSPEQHTAKLPPRKRLVDDSLAIFDIMLGAIAGGGLAVTLVEAFGARIGEVNPMVGFVGPIVGMALGGLLGKKVSDIQYRNGTR